MRLIGVASLALMAVSCAVSQTSPTSLQEPVSRAAAKPKADQPKVMPAKLLTRDEIMGTLAPALRAEVAFLYESWAHYFFGGNGINNPPRAKTAFARILCTGDPELFLRLARAQNPTVASYGIRALSIFAPFRLPEMLPELVTRSGSFETLSGCIGGSEGIGSLAALAIPYLDFPRDKELLAATIEAWLGCIETTGTQYNDLGFAWELIHRFNMDTLVGLPFMHAQTCAKLEVFSLDWSEQEFTDAYWQEIRARFGDSAQWRLAVKLGVGAGRWNVKQDQTKFEAGLAASGEFDGEDNRAVAARIDLECLCEWLDPRANVRRYPSRLEIAKAVRELLTEEVLAGMKESKGPARALFDRLLAELCEILAEPAMPPNSAQDLANIIRARSEGRLTVADDDLDNWLCQWPEAYDLVLQGREHTLDFQFVNIERSNRLLPRWWLQTLERGTPLATEALLHEMSLWHEHAEDALKDEPYCEKMRARMEALAKGRDKRLKWAARRALFREDGSDSDNPEAELARSRLLMSWLPELIEEYGQPDVPAQAGEGICDDLRGIAWNAIFKYSGEDNTASADDVDAFEDDPFWALAQKLYLADTQVDQHPEVYSRLMTLADLRRFEKTPQVCWDDYVQAKESLRGKNPADSPNHVKPERERK